MDVVEWWLLEDRNDWMVEKVVGEWWLIGGV